MVDVVDASQLTLVTQAAAARMLGISRQAVSKAVHNGRLKSYGDRKLIDAASAKRELSASMARLDIADGDEDADEEDGAPLTTAPSLTQLKARTEEERSALLKIQRLEREGALVSRERVDLEQETAARLVRQALDAVASKAEDIYAVAHAGGVLAVRKALKEMMREVQEGLSAAMIAAADQIEAQRYSEDDDAAA